MGPTWQQRIEVASGPAERGPWRMNDSDYRWVDDPSVDLGPAGHAVVAWVDQARKDVLLQGYDGLGRPLLEAPSNVSRSPETFSWLPRVVTAPGEPRRVHVFWQEIVFSGGSHGGEAFFSTSNDGGASFGEPLNLSNSPAGDGKGRLSETVWDNGSLDLAVASNGELYVAWTEYEGALWLRRSDDGGRSFAAPVHVAGSHTEPARGPSLAVGADGVVHLAWAVGESPSADVRYATSLDAGRSFSAPQLVAPSEGHSDAPKLAVDARGTVHLAYAESTTAESTTAESTAAEAGSYHVRYSRRPADAESFEAPRAFRHASGASAHHPDLALDDRGRVYLIWEHYPNLDERPQGLAFTQSNDGGQHFASPVLLPEISHPSLGHNGSQQGLLSSKLAVFAGQIAVVNSTFRAGEASHVWLLRGRPPE